MNDFTQGNIAKQIILFSVPMLIGSLFQQMYGMVDAVVVGRFLGSGALAAVGVSMSAFQFFIAALFGLTTGASVVISQFFGAKAHGKLRVVMSTSVIFLTALSLVMTVLGTIFTPTLLRFLNAHAAVFDYAVTYMRVQMSGLVFVIFFNMYTAYLRAMGNSRTPLYILIFSTTFNGLLNILLVVVLGLGVGAVSAGTVVSQGLAALICYIYTRRNVPLLRVIRHVPEAQVQAEATHSAEARVQVKIPADAKAQVQKMGTISAQQASSAANSKSAAANNTEKPALTFNIFGIIFDWNLFTLILKYGLPAALQLSIVTFAHLTITRLINDFGTAAMAGITSASRIDQMVMMPVSTLSLALATFVGQNMGANMEERAKQGFRTTLMYMVGLAVAISAILFIASPWLVSVFVDASDIYASEILHTGQSYLRILSAFYFLFAFLFGFNGFYRGAGDAVIAMIFPISSLTIRTLSAYGLVHLAGMGPEALAWSVAIGWGITSSVSFIYYKKRLWAGKVAVK